MSYKMDEVLGMLDEILMRLERIEKLVDFSKDDAPENVKEAFDRVFGKKIDKPTLSVVQSDNDENNIVELKLDE